MAPKAKQTAKAAKAKAAAEAKAAALAKKQAKAQAAKDKALKRDPPEEEGDPEGGEGGSQEGVALAVESAPTLEDQVKEVMEGELASQPEEETQHQQPKKQQKLTFQPLGSKATAVKSAPPVPPKRIPTLDRKEVSSMLTNLKYKAAHSEEGSEASRALKIWGEADIQVRARFLQSWLSEGKGTKKNLKWIGSFEKQSTKAESTTTSYNEGSHFPGTIMGFCGKSFLNFASEEEARTFVEKACLANAKEWGYKPECTIDEDCWALSKYRWTQSGGREQKFTSSLEEKVSRVAGGITQDAMSSGDTGASSSLALSLPAIKEESPGWSSLQESLKGAQLALTSTQRNLMQGQQLVSKVKAKANKDPIWAPKLAEISQAVASLSGFCDRLLGAVSEYSELVQSDDVDFSEKGQEVEQLISTSTHHSGGWKELHRRFSAMFS